MLTVTRARPLWRVRRRRDLQLSAVHRLRLLILPLLPDLRQHAASVDLEVGVRHRLRRPRLRVEDAGIAGVEVDVRERRHARPAAQLIVRVLSNVAEDVGADVVAAEGVRVPVGLDGRDLRVVVVEVRVGGADEVGGDGVAEEDREGAVLLRVRAVLVEGDQDKSVLHEVLVGEERLEEGAQPDTGGSVGADGSVVRVARHVRGDEQPLGQLVGLEVLVEEGEVLDLGETVGVVGDGVVHDGWALDCQRLRMEETKKEELLVLANIVVRASLLVDPCEALVSTVWQVLLVDTPADLLVLEQIDDGGDILRHSDEWVAVQAEVVTADGGHVVGLTGMGDGEVVLEGDALLREEVEVGCNSLARASLGIRWDWGSLRSAAAVSKSVFSNQMVTKRSKALPLTWLVGLSVLAVAWAA